MITQSIRTSKYTTTIDIPAEKLQTKAKFIQISKSPSPSRQQTITFPNECYETEKQNKRLTLQTKIMIEELQQAYNEDVHALQQQIVNLKNTHEIEKLKLENQLEYQRREVELSRKQAEDSQSMLRESRHEKQSIVMKLEHEIQTKQNVVSSQGKQLQTLLTEVKELKRELSEKNALLMSKFRDIETDKDKRHEEERRSLENRLELAVRQKQGMKRQLEAQVQGLRSQCKRYLLQLQMVERENLSVKQQLIECKKDIEFQTSQIDEYIKSLKHLEREKAILEDNNSNLHGKVQQQNLNIQKLLNEMREQTICIEQMQGNGGSGNLIGANHIEEELNVARLSSQEYADLLHQKECQITEKQTLYLLKLKEIDEEKLNNKATLQQLALSQTLIASLKQQLAAFRQTQQHLKSQLTAKIVQYNELLSRPPEHFEVKIQKSIDKKQYIQSLQAKVAELEAIIEQLKQDNSSYVEEIRKKVKETQEAKLKEQSLIKSNDELKDYISSKEKSLGWAVEREIMKDVSISQERSEKASGYKVYVRQSSHSESGGSQIEVSGIQGNKEINFSLESKVQKILEKSRPVKYEV